jgi:hypothetical protein
LEAFEMTTGINRAESYQKSRAGSARKAFTEWRNNPCVFISHQNEDTNACETIAQYLIGLGVDIYFDKYEKMLNQLSANQDPTGVTKNIQEGIDFSTHMICVVSPTTIKSYWVPFEVGYGYSRIILGVLTLKGVEDAMLPEYMKTTRVIRGTRSLNGFISELLGQPNNSLESRASFKATASPHPLDNVLNWNL